MSTGSWDWKQWCKGLRSYWTQRVHPISKRVLFNWLLLADTLRLNIQLDINIRKYESFVPPPPPKKTLNSSPASFFYSLQLHLYFSTIKATIINILQQQWIKWECENNSLFSRQVYSFSLLLYWCCWPQQWAVFSGKKILFHTKESQSKEVKHLAAQEPHHILSAAEKFYQNTSP